MTNGILESLLNNAINGPEVSSQEYHNLIKRATVKWLSGKWYKLTRGKSPKKENLH